MPGFFDIIFGQPEPEPEAPKPKKVKKAKKAKKEKKSEKPIDDFIHPMKRENTRLKAELDALRNPEPEPEPEPEVEDEEPEPDDDVE